MKKLLVLVSVLVSTWSCSQKPAGPPAESTGMANNQKAANYTPRIGVGVSTGSRTCIAIQNANLQSGTAVTVISPLPPSTFIQAEVSGPAKSTCPVSKEIDPSLTSYDLKIAASSVQKLTPMIAVVSSSSVFSTVNNNVQADLDQNGKNEVFRACAGSDGYHLTAWGGDPLTGTLLWHRYYYEPANPGTGPACTPKEMSAP